MPILGRNGKQKQQQQAAENGGSTFVDPTEKASYRTKVGRMATKAIGLPEPFSLGAPLAGRPGMRGPGCRLQRQSPACSARCAGVADPGVPRRHHPL